MSNAIDALEARYPEHGDPDEVEEAVEPAPAPKKKSSTTKIFLGGIAIAAVAMGGAVWLQMNSAAPQARSAMAGLQPVARPDAVPTPITQAPAAAPGAPAESVPPQPPAAAPEAPASIQPPAVAPMASTAPAAPTAPTAPQAPVAPAAIAAAPSVAPAPAVVPPAAPSAAPKLAEPASIQPAGMSQEVAALKRKLEEAQAKNTDLAERLKTAERKLAAAERAAAEKPAPTQIRETVKPVKEAVAAPAAPARKVAEAPVPKRALPVNRAFSFYAAAGCPTACRATVRSIANHEIYSVVAGATLPDGSRVLEIDDRQAQVITTAGVIQ